MLWVMFLLPIFGLIAGRSCPSPCRCYSDLITCVGAKNPRFDRNLLIRHVSMSDGYIRDVVDITVTFPNLERLTLSNMLYVNCQELKEIWGSIFITQDYCWMTTSETSKILYIFIINIIRVMEVLYNAQFLKSS